MSFNSELDIVIPKGNIWSLVDDVFQVVPAVDPIVFFTSSRATVEDESYAKSVFFNTDKLVLLNPCEREIYNKLLEILGPLSSWYIQLDSFQEMEDIENFDMEKFRRCLASMGLGMKQFASEVDGIIFSRHLEGDDDLVDLFEGDEMLILLPKAQGKMKRVATMKANGDVSTFVEFNEKAGAEYSV